MEGVCSQAPYTCSSQLRIEGIDCDETFNFVVKPATICTVLSLAVSRDSHIHQLDAKNVFLHGHLSEIVYMHQPPGFVDSRYSDYVCHLQRSLYGLKRGPHARFQRFATRIDFQHSKTDTSLFVFNRGSDIAYLLLYVDDIIITASSLDILERIIVSLHKEILEQTNIHNCILCRTPVDTKSKLGSDGDHVSDPTLYSSLVGALYAFFVMFGVLLIMVYNFMSRLLLAYTDVDWAGCSVTVGPHLGIVCFLLWSEKRQITLSHSSAEAEYRGVANVVAETVWIHNLLRELHNSLFIATLVYCDNASAVYMSANLSANLVQHQRTKHIEIDIHFVRDFVASRQVRVLHIPSRFQYANIFMKSLPTALFLEFRSNLNV
nr:ribonuclease H-like domain-containing protein [Tanacetum cinerariifolium]